MKLEWNKIVSNAVTVLVATVFVGAATYLWRGVDSIDERIDHNLTHIRSTQAVLAPKVDEIEKKLVEILEHVDHGDEINLILPKKGSQSLLTITRVRFNSSPNLVDETV